MKKLIFNFSLILLFLAFSINSDVVLSSAEKALSLCLTSVIPSLFPFFILSNLLISSGACNALSKIFSPFMKTLFGTSGNSSLALILGFLSGYPIGARTIADLYMQKLCSKEEANRLLLFCNNTGPAFTLGIIGAVIFKNPAIGLWVYIIHILSAVLVGIILNIVSPINISHAKPVKPICPPPFSGLLTESIKISFMSTLNVSAFVIFFAIIISLTEHYHLIYLALLPFSQFFELIGVNSEILQSLIYGKIELTSGLFALKDIPYNLSQRAIASAVILSFGSVSVLFQSIAFISDTDLSIKNIILGKVFHGISSFILSSLAFFLFYTDAIGVFMQIPIYTYSLYNTWIIFVYSSLVLIFLLVISKLYWKNE